MNKKGLALIFVYLVIMILTIIGSAFFCASITEKNSVVRQSDSTRAFWIAEAGLSQAYANWSNGVAQPDSAVSFGGGTYNINVSSLPNVTITAVFGTAQRTLNAVFTRIPTTFDNTLSVGRNMSLAGLLAKVNVRGKTRISGSYSQTFAAQGTFEDKQTGVDQSLTTIKLSDYDDNGTQDQFSDFVQFGRNVVNAYPSNQVAYIKNNGTVVVIPNGAMLGKKILFVEGAAAGQGNVNIVFDGTWRANEDLTIIATGNITYLEPLQFNSPARLSTISWGDYNEASIFRSQHESVIYTHEDANFVDVLDWGTTTGNVIANRDVSLLEVLTNETYYYSDRAKKGDMPPGFERLNTTSGTGKLTNWSEAK